MAQADIVIQPFT
jgi:hypothetical protein